MSPNPDQPGQAKYFYLTHRQGYKLLLESYQYEKRVLELLNQHPEVNAPLIAQKAAEVIGYEERLLKYKAFANYLRKEAMDCGVIRLLRLTTPH